MVMLKFACLRKVLNRQILPESVKKVALKMKFSGKKPICMGIHAGVP
jgi:hypothetical protein